MKTGRDLVREAAQLLSSAEPLDRLFERLRELLAQFLDASIMFVVTGNEREAYGRYVFYSDHGGMPDDINIPPGTASATVLSTGKALRYGRREQWIAQTSILLEGELLKLPQSALFVPIPFGGTTVGALSVQSLKRDAYSEEDLALLESCALYLGARIHDEDQTERQAGAAHFANVDPLTGLPNRRGFDEALAIAWTSATAQQQPICIALLELNQFKEFDALYGHRAGDTCLRNIAHALTRCMRHASDMLAHTGVEQFAAILPHTSAQEGERFCESLRETIARLAIAHEAAAEGIVTASTGVYAVIPTHPERAEDGLERAGEMLERAKRSYR